MSKLQPVPLTLTFELGNVGKSGAGPGTPGTVMTYYCDLSQCKSLVARKFFRQGLVHAVGGMRLISAAVAPGTTSQVAASPLGNIMISKLPTSWPSSNGWHKTMASWKEQQDEAIADSGSESSVAKFRDFKIFMDVDHVTQFVDATQPSTQSQNILPVSVDGFTFDEATPGEWEPSIIVLPNVNPDASGSEIEPDEVYLHMVGINNNGGVSRGIIDGYANSRAYPQSPDPVSAGLPTTANFLNRMFNDGNANPEIVSNAVDRNDDLPYPQANYPGADTQMNSLECSSLDNISGSTVGGVTYIKGNSFPCGLIRIDITNFDGTYDMYNLLQIDLVPGRQNGYLTEPMQDL